MELSRSDTSCLLLAERAQLLELPYVAFGAAIEPGFDLVRAGIPQSSAPLAEDVTAAVVQVPGQRDSRTMRNPWQPASLAQLVRQLALPALASQVKVFSFASVAECGSEYLVARKRHFPDQTPSETRDLEVALRAIEGVSADGLANRVSTPSPERPAPVNIGVVGILVELNGDGSLLVHRQGGRRVVIPFVIEPFHQAAPAARDGKCGKGKGFKGVRGKGKGFKGSKGGRGVAVATTAVAATAEALTHSRKQTARALSLCLESWVAGLNIERALMLGIEKALAVDNKPLTYDKVIYPFTNPGGNDLTVVQPRRYNHDRKGV